MNTLTFTGLTCEQAELIRACAESLGVYPLNTLEIDSSSSVLKIFYRDNNCKLYHRSFVEQAKKVGITIIQVSTHIDADIIGFNQLSCRVLSGDWQDSFLKNDKKLLGFWQTGDICAPVSCSDKRIMTVLCRGTSYNLFSPEERWQNKETLDNLSSW